MNQTAEEKHREALRRFEEYQKELRSKSKDELIERINHLERKEAELSTEIELLREGLIR